MQSTMLEHAQSRFSDGSCASCHFSAGGDGEDGEDGEDHSLASTRSPEAWRQALEVEVRVMSVLFSRVAAKAGEPEAEGYRPSLTANSAAALEAPLDSLPEGWVQEAFERVDSWIERHGLPTRSAR